MKWLKKKWEDLQGYRTMILNVLAMILPILELNEFTAIIPDRYLPYYVLGLAIANMYMRKKTTTPLGKKSV